MTNTEFGQSGVTDLIGKLRKYVGGSVVSSMGYASPFDILVNGWRVEVKRARPNKNMRWEVNIHRHGKLNESQVDRYVFCLDAVPGNGKMPIYLIFEAPLKVKRMCFSFSSLLRNNHAAIDNWELLKPIKGSKRVQP